ncbi:hypothetical protein LTR84_009751 [Exophiala bonariae]|uniref:Peptidase A1 domain-containing protein n=1 Tax=Exophiala bonariae TaxID=1690606 RepID=A0AAV9NJM0_9EURO|nr:hypothetical protein LTR84_009751 [Exophiala bonariae]
MYSFNFCISIFLTTLSLRLFSLAPVQAIPINNIAERDREARTLRMPIRRQFFSISKRSNVLSSILKNQEWQYLIDVKVGTPPQSLSLALDTGSSDTWVFSPEACVNDAKCAGSFDPAESSTLVELSAGSFAISYNDKSHVEGDFITDDLGVGGTTISSLTMGLVRTDALTGTILFGGYDTRMFQGHLTVMPTLPNTNGVISTFLVSLFSLSAIYNGKTTTFTASTFSGAALLDSGTALTWVPSAIYAELANYFGADSDGLVDCSLGQTKGHVSFEFAGVVIQVPFSELSLYDSTTHTCSFGFYDGGTLLILGDTFLRSAYVYYDLGNNQIGLAQTVYE